MKKYFPQFHSNISEKAWRRDISELGHPSYTFVNWIFIHMLKTAHSKQFTFLLKKSKT